METATFLCKRVFNLLIFLGMSDVTLAYFAICKVQILHILPQCLLADTVPFALLTVSRPL